MKGGYILLNGTFYRENEPLFSSLDIQRFADGIKEEFRAEDNMILFAEENYNHLLKALEAVDYKVPPDWDLSRLKHDVSRLLNKNHLFLASRIQIRFFKGTDSTYYILSAEEIPRGYFPIIEPGLMIDFYCEGVKAVSRFSRFETSSRFLWITAFENALLKSKDNVILFNDKGHACEGINTSFCYLKEETAVFPSLASLGYQPPLIAKIIKCAKSCGFRTALRNDISSEELLNADELFLIDNSLGIQKVLGLGERRYYNTRTTAIALKLNELAIKETTEH